MMLSGCSGRRCKSAGKVDRQAVRDALAKIPNYEGVTGNMQFQEGSGDPIKSAVILQVEGRQVRLLCQRQSVNLFDSE